MARASRGEIWLIDLGLVQKTRPCLVLSIAFLDHERAKSELKNLIPEDVKEAIGHGVRAKRSKSGAVSFDVLATTEALHAPVQ